MRAMQWVWCGLWAACPAAADDFPTPEIVKPRAIVADARNADKAAAPPPAAKAAEAKPKPEAGLHKIARVPLRHEVVLDGVFESATAAEILAEPESWAEFKVLEAVEHGAAVRKGDPLLAFETKKIDEDLGEAAAAATLAELELKEAAEDLKSFEATHPLDLQAAARAQELAETAWQRYLARDKAMTVKGNDMQLKSSEHSAESAAEELRQLEKMYRAEDLREDTEEIVLRRARNGAEQSKFFLESAKQRHEDFVKEGLMAQEAAQKDGLERGRAGLAKSKAAGPLLLAQKRLKHEKAARDVAKGAERLAKLRGDRKLLAFAAPIDGLAYYGKCDKGHWTSPGVDRYRKGSALKPGEVWMTVVKPRPLFVRASVAEKDARALRVGLAGKAVPTAEPDQRLPVRVDALAAAPLGGTFDARIAVTAPEDAAQLLPGMTCKMTFVTFQKEALAAPAKAVFTDERDDAKRYVWRRNEDGKPERRDVAVGRTLDDKAEIAGGLKEGDEIYLEKPPAGGST